MAFNRHGIKEFDGVAGRKPFQVTADLLDRAAIAGKLGFNKGQLATYLGISDETLRVHAPDHPEILEAYQRGKLEGIEEVAGKLYRNATEMAIGPKGDPIGTPGGSVQAQQIYLKQVAEWRDKVELSGNAENPVRIVLSIPNNNRLADGEGT